MNFKLFEKSINLRNFHIFGGRNGVTWKTCTEPYEDNEGCTGETTYTYDDNGVLKDQCTVMTCPD